MVDTAPARDYGRRMADERWHSFRRRVLELGPLGRALAATGAFTAGLIGSALASWLAGSVGSIALLAGVVLVFPLVLWGIVRLEQQQHRYEQELSTLTAEGVARQIGAQPEFVSTTAPTPGRPVSPSEQAQMEQEVARRVELATNALLDVQRAQAEGLELRMRVVEEKFPDPAQFQKFADANQLLLAYQLGELAKRVDRIDEKQLTRTQVAGIVITTIATAIGVIAALFNTLKAAGLLH